jgi:hypothetical protein
MEEEMNKVHLLILKSLRKPMQKKMEFKLLLLRERILLNKALDLCMLLAEQARMNQYL